MFCQTFVTIQDSCVSNYALATFHLNVPNQFWQNLQLAAALIRVIFETPLCSQAALTSRSHKRRQFEASQLNLLPNPF